MLADSRYKDNRIPPQGFDIDNAAARLVRPVVNSGTVQPDLYTTQEYAGGYDDVTLLLETGADRVEISLLYQTTSREFVTFLRDEINCDADTLPTTAYIAQDPAEPFFDQLHAWGNTIFELWQHNADVPSAAPVAISVVTLETEPCIPESELCDGLDNNCNDLVDENYSALSESCEVGVGECVATGSVVCTSDGSGTECSVQAGTPAAEQCDALDNNCNGSVDEDFIGVGSSCGAGTGICAATGKWECTLDGSSLACSAQPKSADTEQCDGIDNDCDGITDEGFAYGQPCNDGNGCTVNDQFSDCTCIGTTYSCEPAMCELSAICDGFGGCDVVWADANTPCDDSDPSTEPDLCSPFGKCIGSTTDTDSSTDTIATFDSDSDRSTDTQTAADSDIDTADTGTIDTDTNPEPSNTDSDSLHRN